MHLQQFFDTAPYTPVRLMVAKIRYLVLLTHLKSFFFVQLMLLDNTKYGSFTFNKFKVIIWKLLQIFNALLFFNRSVKCSLHDNVL